MLVASCAQEKDAVISPVVGPCAGQPPGCGTARGDAQALAGGTWSSFSSGPLSPRGGQGSVWTGHEFVIWGGASGNGAPLGDGASYNPDTGKWTILPLSPLAPRYPEVSVWAGSEAIFWGGHTNTPQTFADGAAYDPGTRRWTRLAPSPLAPMNNATGIWTGTSLIIFGGDAPQSGKTLSDGAVYHPDTDTWDVLPPLPQPTNASVATTTVGWAGTELVVVTTYEHVTRSGSSSETTVFQEALAWVPGSATWRHISIPSPGDAIIDAHPTWTGHQLLFVGGTGCLPLASCPALFTGYGFAYDPGSDTWSSLPSNVVLVHSLPGVWTGQALLALNAGTSIGGSSGAVLSPGDGAVYDVSTNTWLSLPRSPLTNLDSASVAWTGRQLLVWASGNIGGMTAGEALNPSSPSHRAVTTAQQAIALVRPGPQYGVTRSAAKLTTWEEALAAGSPGASVPGSPEPLGARVWVVAFSVKHWTHLGPNAQPDHWVAYVVDQKTGNNPEIMSGPATWPPFFDALHNLSAAG
jgi:hypothetical protein